MATLAELTERVLRMESQGATNDSNTRLAIHDCINEAYRKFNRTEAWPWLVTTATLAVDLAGGDTGESITLPADFCRVIDLSSAAGVTLSPRSLERHLHYKEAISRVGGLATYALAGTDSVTGLFQLSLVPAATDDLTLTYLRRPANLLADSDSPVGIEEIGDYLVRQARVLRICDDEERTGLLQLAQQRAAEAFLDIKRATANTILPLTGQMVPLK